MPGDLQSLVDLVVRVTTFVLALSLWIGGVLLWVARRKATAARVGRRLRLDDGEPPRRDKVLRLWHQGVAASTTVTVATERRRLLEGLDERCRRAGWSIGAGGFVALVGGVAAISGLFCALVMSNPLLGGGVAIAVVIVARMVMGARIAKRDALFDRQLVDAMELASRSLRAGHPLPGAFRLVAEEMAPPIRDVFGELCQRHEMGETLAEALQAVARTSTSADLKMFATSVAIQMRSGGNLADVMERLATVVRERTRLGRRVRVLSSQTQMSKRVLIVLPFLAFIGLNLLNPTYMSPLYTTTMGHALLAVGTAQLAIGAWVINRMATLKY